MQTLKPIERSFERLAAENLPILNLVQSIRIRGNLLHAEMLDISYLLTLQPTPETRQAIQLEIHESDYIRQELLVDVQEYRRLVERFFPEESLYIPLLQMQVDQLVLVGEELKKRAAGQAAALPLAERSQIRELEKRFLEVTDQIIREEIRVTRIRRERVNETVAQARFWIVGISFLFLVSALLLAYLITRRLSRPVRLLEAAADELAENRIPAAVDVNSHDEMGKITKAFNVIRARLESQQASQGNHPEQGGPPADASSEIHSRKD